MSRKNRQHGKHLADALLGASARLLAEYRTRQIMRLMEGEDTAGMDSLISDITVGFEELWKSMLNSNSRKQLTLFPLPDSQDPEDTFSVHFDPRYSFYHTGTDTTH